MIMAQNTVEGKDYYLILSSNVIRKFKIVRINKSVDRNGQEICTSVSVLRDEDRTVIQISGGSVLEEVEKKYGSRAEDKKKPVTRSLVIDRLLSKVSLDKDPEWEELYNSVVKEYGGSERDRLNIISQARERWKWYKSGQKVNPYLNSIEKG